MRKYTLVFLITTLLWGANLYSVTQNCAPLNLDRCPEGFLCKEPVPYKGKFLKEKMDILQKEFDKPWQVRSVKIALGSKIYGAGKSGAVFLGHKIVSGVSFLNKKIKNSAAVGKFNKTKVSNLLSKLSEKVSNYHLVKPMDKDHKSNLVNTEKKTVKLKYETTDTIDGKVVKSQGKTKFYLYQSRKWGNEKRPLLIIMPPVYGISPFDIGMAVSYVKDGYKVVIIELGGFEFISPFQHTSLLPKKMVKSIGDVHRSIEYMVKAQNVDREKIGIFGFSLGGIFASLAFSVHKDIKALALAVGGGNFPEILTNSHQAMAILYRKYRMKEEKIKTKEEYFKVMQKAFSYDPVRFAHLKNPKDVYLVLTEGDTAVPTKNQRDLEKAFGASCKIGNSRWEHGEHFVAIVKDLLKRGRINKFFKERLGVK